MRRRRARSSRRRDTSPTTPAMARSAWCRFAYRGSRCADASSGARRRIGDDIGREVLDDRQRVRRQEPRRVVVDAMRGERVEHGCQCRGSALVVRIVVGHGRTRREQHETASVRDRSGAAGSPPSTTNIVQCNASDSITARCGQAISPHAAGRNDEPYRHGGRVALRARARRVLRLRSACREHLLHGAKRAQVRQAERSKLRPSRATQRSHRPEWCQCAGCSQSGRSMIG